MTSRLSSQRRMWMLQKAKEQELEEELEEQAEKEKKKVVWLTAEQKEQEENT